MIIEEQSFGSKAEEIDVSRKMINEIKELKFLLQHESICGHLITTSSKRERERGSERQTRTARVDNIVNYRVRTC